MSFAKGQPLSAEDYKDFLDATPSPTFSASFTLKGPSGQTNQYRSSAQFGSHFVPRTHPYTIRFEAIIDGTPGDHSFRIYEDGVIVFSWTIAAGAPSLNSSGYVYAIDNSVPFHTYYQVTLPPSDTTLYHWEAFLNDNFFQRDSAVWEVRVHCAENTMVAGDRVSKWNDNFTAEIVTPYEDGGLSFADAQKGLFGKGEAP